MSVVGVRLIKTVTFRDQDGEDKGKNDYSRKY